MKKLNKRIAKIDSVVLMVAAGLYVGFVGISVLKNSVLGTLVTSFLLPVCSFALQSILIKKQENRNYNIELVMSDSTEPSIVWKNSCDKAMENISYLEITNTGQVDIYEIFFKVIKNDGAIVWFRINENLKKDATFVIRVPFKRETLKEVTITCNLQTESRTKKYSGHQSCGKEEKYIFSKIDRFDEEKYSIMYEDACEGFEDLERFWEDNKEMNI